MALQKVTPGQPLQFKASAYNAFVDAAEAVRSNGLLANAGLVPSQRRSGIVLVRNDSGDDQDRFAVLTLDGVVIEPDDNEREFLSKPAFKAVTPGEADANGGDPECQFVILQEPIKDGKIGKAMIAGISPVKLYVDHEPDQYAWFDKDETGHLVTSHTGPARILYKEDGTGEVWGVVEFPVHDGARILVINGAGEIPTGGAMNLTGTDGETPYAFNVEQPDEDNMLTVFPNDGPPIPAGERRWRTVHPILRFKVADSDLEPEDVIGTAKNSWSLTKGKTGFVVVCTESHDDGEFAYCRYHCCAGGCYPHVLTDEAIHAPDDGYSDDHVDYPSIWHLESWQGDGIAPPGSYWRMMEVGACLKYNTGCVNADGRLVGLPSTFESDYDYYGYMELQIGCVDPDDDNYILWPGDCRTRESRSSYPSCD